MQNKKQNSTNFFLICGYSKVSKTAASIHGDLFLLTGIPSHSDLNYMLKRGILWSVSFLFRFRRKKNGSKGQRHAGTSGIPKRD